MGGKKHERTVVLWWNLGLLWLGNQVIPTLLLGLSRQSPLWLYHGPRHDLIDGWGALTKATAASLVLKIIWVPCM